MKKALLILVICFLTSITFAQSFQKGTNVLNAGIGIGSNLGGLGNARPAINVSFEHGMWETGGPGVISLGGYFGNTGYSFKEGSYSQKWNYNIIGIRSAYHYNGFQNMSNLDVYGGMMLGYNIVSYKSKGFDLPNNYGSNLGLSAYLGGRWFFTEKLGLYAELGYGVSTINAGVSLKL